MTKPLLLRKTCKALTSLPVEPSERVRLKLGGVDEVDGKVRLEAEVSGLACGKSAELDEGLVGPGATLVDGMLRELIRALVAGPRRPTGGRLFCFWNLVRAWNVAGPNLLISLPGEPGPEPITVKPRLFKNF